MFQLNAAQFSRIRASALIVGRTPTSAADPLVGLFELARACVTSNGVTTGPALTKGLAQGFAPPEFRNIHPWEDYGALCFSLSKRAKLAA